MKSTTALALVGWLLLACLLLMAQQQVPNFGGVLYNSSAPAMTSGTTVPHQSGPNGNLLVQPFRRSQTAAVTGSIASTTAATMIAAGASGVYNDITTLVLTESAESTAAYITVNISDGSKTYEFGFLCEAVGTAGGGSWPVTITFNPPLPATSTATAWTIAQSAADCTVRYDAVYVQQTANF